MDDLLIPPALHSAVGGVCLLLAAGAAGLTWDSVRKGTFGPWPRAGLIVLQVALMVQAAVGIKLLDQGMGPLQKYVHYLGGLGALGLLMLFYWLPQRSPQTASKQAAWLSSASLVFVALTFFVGQTFVRGQLGQ